MPSETTEPPTSISPTPTPSSTSTSTSSNVVIVGSYDSRGITSAAGGNNNNNNNNSGYGDNNNNMEDSPNFLRTTSYDPTPYVQRARVTRAAPPKPACNPLQFVQIKPCNLYQSAQDQLKRAEEVKKVKEIKKEEPEDWQSNLDNWKSCRRKRVEHIIDRVVEVKKLELEEHDRTRRKSKTFSEMLEERGTKGRTKVSLAVYAPVDDDGNDLSDLGIGTSSASGKSSLSEDYDNHSGISDNQDVEKSNTSDFELHNNRNNNNHTIKMNNNNNNGNNHQQNITDDDDDEAVGGDGRNNNNHEVNQQQHHIVINNNQNHNNNNGNGHETIEDDDCCLQLNDSIKMLNISRDYASSPGYDTSSSSTAPASSPDPCEYTYEGAIENYKSRILKTTQPPPPPSPRMQIPSSTTTATTITTNKIEERLLKNFELKSPIIDQKDVFSPSSAIGNNKIDVLKRRELFEKDTSSYSSSSSSSNRQLPSPSTGVINNGIVTAATTKMTSVKERLLNIEKRDDTSIIKDASIVKLNRLSGEFTSNVNNTNYIDGNTNIVKERLVTIEKKNEYNHQGLPNSTTTTNGTNGNLAPINMINKTKIDVPVVPLRDRLLSLQSATTNNQSSSMDDFYQNTNVSESKQSQQPPKQQQAEVIESILNKSTESTVTITNIEQKELEIIEDLPEKCSNNTNNNNNTIINNIPDVIPIIENELIKSNTNTNTITTTTTTTKPIDIVESPLESSTLDATETIENKSEISASSSVIEALDMAFQAIDSQQLLLNPILPMQFVEEDQQNTITLNDNISATTDDVNVTTIKNSSTNVLNPIETIYENIDSLSSILMTMDNNMNNNNNNTTINNPSVIDIEPYYDVISTEKPIPLYENIDIYYETNNLPYPILQKRNTEPIISHHHLMVDDKNNQHQQKPPSATTTQITYENVLLHKPQQKPELIQLIPKQQITFSLAAGDDQKQCHLEPPKEKPPPPPTDDDDDDDDDDEDDEDHHNANGDDVNNNNIHSLSNNVIGIDADDHHHHQQHPQHHRQSDHYVNEEDTTMKRMNSTKRIKKEIRNKRSSFLGLEDTTHDDDDQFLESSVGPPPDMMTAFIQAERRLDKQMYIKAGLYDSSDTTESRDSGVSENHSRQSSEPLTLSSSASSSSSQTAYEELNDDYNHNNNKHNVSEDSINKIQITATTAINEVNQPAAKIDDMSKIMQKNNLQNKEHLNYTNNNNDIIKNTAAATAADNNNNNNNIIKYRGDDEESRFQCLENQIREQEELLRVERELLQLQQAELARQREKLIRENPNSNYPANIIMMSNQSNNTMNNINNNNIIVDERRRSLQDINVNIDHASSYYVNVPQYPYRSSISTSYQQQYTRRPEQHQQYHYSNTTATVAANAVNGVASYTTNKYSNHRQSMPNLHDIRLSQEIHGQFYNNKNREQLPLPLPSANYQLLHQSYPNNHQLASGSGSAKIITNQQQILSGPIPPAKPLRLKQQQQQHQQQQQQQQLNYNPQDWITSRDDTIRHSKMPSADGNFMNDVQLRNPQQQQQQQHLYQSQPLHLQQQPAPQQQFSNMTRHTLHALSAVPKPKFQDAWIVQQQRINGSGGGGGGNQEFINNEKNANDLWLNGNPHQHQNSNNFHHHHHHHYQSTNGGSMTGDLSKRKSDYVGNSNNKHWLIQEAEQRRIDQERGVTRAGTNATTMTTTPTMVSATNGWSSFNNNQNNNNIIRRKGSNDDKPLPESVIQTLTQRVQNCGLGERKKYDHNQKNIHIKPTAEDLLAATKSATASTIITKTQHFHHEPPKKEILSVSGKKKCSYCGDELGRGAAMIIESLHLFYHLDCFKCCVCRVQLGDGISGADVRVRNQKLHCHNCFSSDDGIKFSCV